MAFDLLTSPLLTLLSSFTLIGLLPLSLSLVLFVRVRLKEHKLTSLVPKNSEKTNVKNLKYLKF